MVQVMDVNPLDIIMKQYLNPDLVAGNIYRNGAVSVGPNCLFAFQNIPPNQTLLTVKQSCTLCHSTVPKQFKQLLQFIQGVTIESEPHQLSKTMTLQSQLLLFYLIYLKTTFVGHQLYGPWLSRPINGMYDFHRTVIEETDNLDLLINYVALQNHLNILTSQLFSLFSTPNHRPVLQLLTNKPSCSLGEFRKLYVWSYYFINSRSFGYTEEYTLIPVFDMINHSSRNDNIQQIVTAKPVHTESEVIAAMGNYDQDNDGDQSDNDSEEDPNSLTITKVEAPFLDLYYHVISTDTIYAGQELLLKYGSRNNMFLLQGYGFVEEFNRYDSLIVYYSTNTEDIWYDSVKGACSISGKLKRQTFDFQILLNLKKYYYGRYYKREHTKAKVIWSLPKDRQFQKYFLLQILKRMGRYGPKLHYLSQLNGSHQIHLWQKERKSIFDANIRFILYLCKQLANNDASFEKQLQKQLSQIIHTSAYNDHFPLSILQYGTLLRKISE